MVKYRKIPKINKEDLYQSEIGYHNIPNWLVITLVSVVGLFSIISILI